ncbi:MAG: class I SAM-dependent methyltransferase [Elusimicrobia bacterium]|nr:class I SAM-dependent methyltransferase [Elusimicrobiota bacterium]
MTDVCVVCGGSMALAFPKGRHAYASCGSCGTASMVPSPTDDEIEGHYRAKFNDGNYELIRRFADSYRNVYRGFLAEVAERFRGDGRGLRGLRLLEVGCFTGEFLVLAQEAGCDVMGYELQDEAVAEAQKTLPGRVRKIDVHDRGLDGDSYDAVCLFGVVEHVRDPKGLVARCVQMLKPGGWIFVQTPDRGSLPARALGRFWPPYAPIEHINLLPQSALESMLTEAGCEDFRARAHWKSLPIEYIFEMMRHFGPELRTLVEPVYRLTPKRLRAASLPFYAGEMLASARRKADR